MHISQRRAIPAVSEGKLREEAWRNAPTIAERFPRARRFAIAMTFRDPRGGTPSPRRQLYEPSMHAFFELRCPLRDCASGGFDLNAEVQAMLSRDGHPRSGHGRCRGKRDGEECGLELTYTLTSAVE